MTDKELEARLKVITDLLKEIKKVQDRHEVTTDKEIADLHDFTIEVAKLGAVVEAVHSGQKNLAVNVSEKTSDAVSDAIDEAVKPIVESKWQFWKKKRG